LTGQPQAIELCQGVLERVLPEDCAGAEGVREDQLGSLWTGEGELVARAVAKRRQEVIVGRQCARRALAGLGAPVVALPPDADRVPRWPRGVCGSITHTEGYVAAAVAWIRRWRGLGIDAERVARVKADLTHMIATEDEAKWLRSLAAAEQGRARALLFSAKEAAYKCHFPFTRERCGFHDAVVELGTSVAADDGIFRVRFCGPPRAARLSWLEGRYHFANGLVLTACAHAEEEGF
jgi:4'-phosphopantetheinyl transferase EntD